MGSTIQYGVCQTPSTYFGWPFSGLKIALNYYASNFGIKGVLWHQGEADADQNANSGRTTNTQDYTNKLNTVISKTRAYFPGLSWAISRVTYNRFGNYNSTDASNIRQGQSNVASANFYGPDTDASYQGVSTVSFRNSGDGTHFDESRSNGLTILGNEWYNSIASSLSSFNPISANLPLPITVQVSGTNRILSVPSNYAEYRWGDINYGSSSNTTIIGSGGASRCFIRDNNGNWRLSPIVAANCPSCREGLELDTDDPGLKLVTYPNPIQKDFTVEFDVRYVRSHVLLQIIQSDGKVIKTLVDGIHDSGHWKYPVLDLQTEPNIVYFCRLKVGEIYTTKKLLNVK